MTISEYASQIRAGTLRPSELVARCLKRIDALEPRIRAWVCIDRDQALAAAKQLDAELAEGKYRGPLHGIPVGIKDIVDVRGFPTRAGSPLTSEASVTQDAAVVARLRAAGAVILGKTVTTEYASFDPPVTRNPWNLQHTPGGSSSGSAAAVAAGMCVAAVGTQTGGSIIRPASYCGVYGFKPTFDRLPLDGVVPFSRPMDHIGPIAGCVDDLKIMFEAMSGDTSAQSKAGDAVISAPRLGLIETYFLEEADAGVVSVTRDAMARLQSAGAQVSVVSLPDGFCEVHAMHGIVMAVGAAVVHRDQFASHADEYGREIAKLVRRGLDTSRETYAAALEHQRGFRAALTAAFANVDVLVTPATATPAPTAESTGDPKFNSPLSYTGLPSVSLPCGLSADGLPLSLQLIGKCGSDDNLLSVAAWIEMLLGFDRRPALDTDLRSS